jgi:hypothetical protein
MANLIIWNCLNEDINASRPLGAHQLSGWLRSHGYTVKVIDFCHALSTDALVSLTFIVGLPHEDEKSLTETHEFCIKNNISSWIYLQLYMNKNFAQSEFEKNFESYGFSFPNPMKNDYWVNDLWTHETAIKKTQELNYEPRRMGMVKPMHGTSQYILH